MAFPSLDTLGVELFRLLYLFSLSCQAPAQGVAASGRDEFRARLEPQLLHLADGDGA